METSKELVVTIRIDTVEIENIIMEHLKRMNYEDTDVAVFDWDRERPDGVFIRTSRTLKWREI
uniref:Uncharacterized protein n=1 Tax=viral metagenome TaxID=1070528 RepID=A0A6M3KAK4_9ZZZZ